MSGAELGIAVGGGILTEIGKLFYKCIGQKIGRVFKHQSYMEDMDNQLLLLRNRKEREERRIEHAVRQGNEIHEDVRQWLTDVNLLVELVENPTTGLRVQGQANTHCFKGICPNFMTRYKLSKQAEKAAKDTTMLMEKNFSVVSYPSGLQRTASMFVRDYEGFDSRESVLQDIMEALQDAKINMIGVYGLGGVGKTTLVNKVAWRAIQDKLFDDVVIADVSQKPDHKKIREKIACDLGLEFGLHETEFQRAFRLRNKLKKGKRVLVILDNIWAKPNLEDIGIPLPDYQNGNTLQSEDGQKLYNDEQSIYKILLTSRRPDLLCNDMNTQKNFPLDTLSNGEAQNLFWKVVGYPVTQRSGFQAIAEEIVRKCGGLPLAVATIASALKNKTLHYWKGALDMLRTSNQISIPEMDEKVFKVIKLSFDFLQSDEAKSLFLLCSLVGSGNDISFGFLLRHGMGLGLFQNVDTIEMGRNRVNMLIDNLKASCLLLEGDSSTQVKMHDVVHAVAVSIASTDKLMFNIRVIPDLNTALKKKISKNPTAISFPYRDINDLDQLPAERLECPKLELFMLFMKSTALQIPNHFFEGMKDLKVIDFDCVNLLQLPSSLGYLKNLQTLCLDGCLLGDIATIGELKNLEILSFSRANITHLPGEIGQLTRLKLLDLRDCWNLKVITPNVISRLSPLEELYMDNCFVQWEGGGLANQVKQKNASLAELKQLSHLTTLNICILEAQMIPHGFFFQQLEKYKILIGDVWEWSHKNEASRTMKLKLNNHSSYLGRYAVRMLWKITEDLYLEEWNSIQNVIYELDEEGLPNLKHLHVQNDPKLQYIVNLGGQISYINAEFSLLESLVLYNLINLKNISHGQLKEKSFNKLRMVKLYNCHGLKHLFSISVARSLSLLQEIQVIDCKSLQAVFAEEDDDQNGRNNKHEFTQLHSLTLQGLPQFTSLILYVKTPQTSAATNMAVECKTLFDERVDFLSLNKLKLSSIIVEKIWPEQLSFSMASYCQNLEILTLEGCNGMKFLFSSAMVNSFVKLQQLELRHCMSMEMVIDTTDDHEIVLPLLNTIILEYLPELISFYSGSNIMACPSLKLITIINCAKMEAFVSSDKVDLEDASFFNDKVFMPAVERLTLFSMAIEKIRHNKFLATSSMENLQELFINGCDNLRYLLPSCAVERLVQLRRLTIWHCPLVEGIILTEEARMGKQMFPELRHLRLMDLPDLKMFCSASTNLVEFPYLTELEIDSCHKMKTFISNSISANKQGSEVGHGSKDTLHLDKQPLFDKKVALPNLQHLMVYNMDNLRKIWDGQLTLDSFSKLEELRVKNCSKLPNIFPPIMRRRLQRLRNLLVQNCDSLEDISEIVVEEDVVVDAVLRFVFPQLTSLTLMGLPTLKNFYGGKHISEWPMLKILKMHECVQVKIFASEFRSLREGSQQETAIQQPLFLVDEVAFPNLKELELFKMAELLHLLKDNRQANCNIFRNLATLKVSKCDKLTSVVPSSVCFPNLVRLQVSKCDGLLSIMTTPTAKSLVQLTRLTVADCKMVEEIVTQLENEQVEENIIALNELKFFGVFRLASLRNFCVGNYTFEFASLEKVIVIDCPNVMTYSQRVLRAPKLLVENVNWSIS